MTTATTPTKTPSRSPRRLWLRWVAISVTLYLLSWGATWIFAPSALERWWATHHRPTGSDISGNEEPVEFRTGVPFKGKGFEYGPDFTPQGRWWCCVGRPWCPVPFVVASEVAWIDGPLSGYAGTVYFIWTPFGMIPIHEERVWVA